MVLLKKLCAADGISGDEKDIRDIVEALGKILL